MKCPVCDKENQTMLCPRCGFDSSRDYENYPTFAPVRPAPSVSELRKQWQAKLESQMQPEPIPPKPELLKKKTKLLSLLIAAAFALTLGLGVWIGTCLGGEKSDPGELGESIGLLAPLKTAKQATPNEYFLVIVTEPWKERLLRNDVPTGKESNGGYASRRRSLDCKSRWIQQSRQRRRGVGSR